MATTIGMTSNLTLTLRADLTRTSDFDSGTASLVRQLNRTLTSGTGNDKCNRYYATPLVVNGTSDITLDCSTPAAYDVAGQAMLMTNLKYLIVETTHASLNLTVEPGASNGLSAAFVDKVVVPAGGFVFIANNKVGFTLASDHKNIKIANAGGSAITANVFLIGNQ